MFILYMFTRFYTLHFESSLGIRMSVHVCRVFETMKENGVRPGGKVVYNLIMGSIINDRQDLAEAYAAEFRLNGVK